MKIFLGADHAGFELKERVKHWLKEQGFEVADEGAFELNEKDDYPDFIHLVAKMVQSNPADNRGLIFGGSGQGEAVVANRYARVRAAVYYGGSTEVVRLSRDHNNANVLSIGARFVDADQAKAAIKLWLETGFSGDDRHIRRIAKIDNELKVENEF